MKLQKIAFLIIINFNYWYYDIDIARKIGNDRMIPRL